MTSIAERIARMVAETPDLTPDEIAARLAGAPSPARGPDGREAARPEGRDAAGTGVQGFRPEGGDPGEGSPTAGTAPGMVGDSLERAAVLGAFDLEALVPDGSLGARVRSKLLRHSYPAPSQPGRRILDIPTRHRILAALREEGRLADLLRRAPVDAEDELGQRLRGVLARQDALAEPGPDDLGPDDPGPSTQRPDDPGPDAVPLASPPRGPAGGDPADDLAGPRLATGPGPDGTVDTGAAADRLDDLRVALRASALAGTTPPDSRRAIRQTIALGATRRQFRREAEGFVGRAMLLAEIEESLFGTAARAAAAAAGSPPMVSVSGIGGIGKSAILARLIDRLSDTRPGLLFAHVDFDRPGFGAATPAFLTEQVGRQLAAQLGDDPGALGPALDESDVGLESATMLFDRSRHEIARYLGGQALERPVLLVVDTFEERQRHGEDAVQGFAYWLRLLGAPGSGAIPRLSVLIAGRAPVDETGPGFPPTVAHSIDELSLPERRELLAALGRSATEIDALVPISGNPLVLKLFSRLLGREGGLTLDDIAGAEDEAARLRGDRPRTAPEVLQGVLYDRILRHVEDAEARRLAYPGLVLREIGPDIIREVIAPICLGREIDADEARRLFAALRREVWLLTDSGPDLAAHRPDVRRIMMRYLADDPAVADGLPALHARARAFFESRGNAREADYHFAMSCDPSALEALEAPRAAALLVHVGFDEEHLPPANLATLRARAGLTLSDRDITHLPLAAWEATMAELGPELVARDDHARALLHWRARPGGVRAAPRLWLRRAEDALLLWKTPEAEAFRLAPPPPDLAAQHAAEAALERLRVDAPGDAAAIAAALVLRAPLPGAAADGEAARLARRWAEWLGGPDAVESAPRQEDLAALPRLVTLGWVALAAGDAPEAARAAYRAAARDLLRRVGEASRRRGFERKGGILREEMFRAARLGLSAADGSPASPFAFRPAAAWIAAARDAGGPDHAAEWDRLAADIAAPGLTVSEVTGGIASRAALLLGAPRYGGLAMSPGHAEHRAPARTALCAAITARAPERLGLPLALAGTRLALLAGTAGAAVPADLAATGGTVTADRLRYDVVRLIHYADQADLLPDYLDALCVLFPEEAALEAVRRSLALWTRAYAHPAAAPA